jgi:hypothetical protein
MAEDGDARAAEAPVRVGDRGMVMAVDLFHRRGIRRRSTNPTLSSAIQLYNPCVQCYKRGFISDYFLFVSFSHETF